MSEAANMCPVFGARIHRFAGIALPKTSNDHLRSDLVGTTIEPPNPPVAYRVKKGIFAYSGDPVYGAPETVSVDEDPQTGAGLVVRRAGEALWRARGEEDDNLRCPVLGGNGFMGAHLVDRLPEGGHTA